MHWTCNKCGSKLLIGNNFEINCSNPNCKPYMNHCWSCHNDIDSRFNKKSNIPGMGYVCRWCGQDLQGWKLAKGLITFSELCVLRYMYCNPDNTKNQHYTSHCWKCKTKVDSNYNQKSNIPGMGYVCRWCGEDLQGWKLLKGLITFKQLAMLRENTNAILR